MKQIGILGDVVLSPITSGKQKGQFKVVCEKADFMQEFKTRPEAEGAFYLKSFLDAPGTVKTVSYGSDCRGRLVYFVEITNKGKGKKEDSHIYAVVIPCLGVVEKGEDKKDISGYYNQILNNSGTHLPTYQEPAKKK